MDRAVEASQKERALRVRERIVARLSDAGMEGSAKRLAKGGQPGHEEMGQYAIEFNCCFLILPDNPESFPCIFGPQHLPLGFAVRHLMVADGAFKPETLNPKRFRAPGDRVCLGYVV